jgi:enoyl-CoA hydratase/carnithine racemase
MCLTGDPIDAVRALEIGLVSDLAAPGELRAAVQRIAVAIARCPAPAIRASLQILRSAASLSLEESLVEEREMFRRVMKLDASAVLRLS